MKIEISSEARKFLAYKGEVTGLRILIDQIDEECTRIFNPSIKLLKNNNPPGSSDVDQKIEMEDYTIFISKRFTEIYGQKDELMIDVGGFFEKVLIISNIDAQTKNICKV
ncbi:MAG: hypothetical protein ACOC44_14930 [Promethearchaeia archaeon]